MTDANFSLFVVAAPAMSMEQDQPPEETFVPTAAGPGVQRRGHFFYIAVFFILIAFLCYLLNSTNVTWTQVVPEPSSAPPSSSSPAPH
jgi:hypothetical protein